RHTRCYRDCSSDVCSSDLLLRNSKTGGFEVYDIGNNNITNAAALGTVGLDFQVAGFGDFNRDGGTDMILRNRNTGQFELYNIRKDRKSTRLNSSHGSISYA